jgi:hypothetical protein
MGGFILKENLHIFPSYAVKDRILIKKTVPCVESIIFTNENSSF